MHSVYVVSAGDQAQKIGFAKDPKKRTSDIQVGNHLKTSLYAYVETPFHTEVESVAHRVLKHKRLEGEWFDCSPQEAADTVIWAARICSLELPRMLMNGDIVKARLPHPVLQPHLLYVVEGAPWQMTDQKAHLIHIKEGIDPSALIVVQDAIGIEPRIKRARDIAGSRAILRQRWVI